MQSLALALRRTVHDHEELGDDLEHVRQRQVRHAAVALAHRRERAAQAEPRQEATRAARRRADPALTAGQHRQEVSVC